VVAGRSGKSRFPALARLFGGRWDTRGEFQSGSYADELDTLPRERFLRPLAIVVATAAISFFIVVGLLKLRDTTGSPAPAPVAQPLLTPEPAPPPPAAAAVPAPAAPPRPAPAAAAPATLPPRARPVSDVLERALAQREATRAAPKRAVARRPRARVVVPADPDSPMPLSF